MKKLIFLLTFFYQTITAQTIDKITLEESYRWAEEAFPLTKQKELIKRTNALSANTLQKYLLPQIELNAQATYQSEVTQFPVKIQNVEVEPLSKDQYKTTLDVKQLIWDGGVINLQKNVLKSQADVETQKVEVEINKLKERINQLYFSVLQIDENAKLINLLMSDIAARMKKVEAGIANGTVLRMTAQVLEAENLKAEQRLIELSAVRSASIQMLNELIKKELTDKTVFERPQVEPTPTGIGLQINRPELRLYELQKTQIDQTVKVTSLRDFPRIYAFATGGYGRPGLNFLKNDFALFGIAGITFKWNISNYYTKSLRNDLDILQINRQSIDIQRDLFITNTQILVKQQSAEITKWEQLLEKDKQIVDLRSKIKATAAVQLENGVMTANDYLIELNAESQAMQNLILHDLQLLNAKINLKTITNN